MAAAHALEPGLTLQLLAETSRLVAASPSRLAKIRALSDCLAAMPPAEIAIAVSYLSGVPPQGRIGIRRGTLQAAAAQAPAATPHLTLTAVDNTFQSIEAMRGAGSAAGREALLARLFAAATEAEQDFLSRLITGELRQGALDGLMVEAVAAAARLPAGKVRSAAMYAPGLGALATVALAEGEAGLGQFRMRLFAPVAPMLAQTAADVAEALRELPAPVQFEWKMDGARIQVHKRGHEVRIYTRALNEMGAAIPEIIAAARALPVEEVVLDGEALAHSESGRPHAFQVTMRRFGRRLNIQALLEELPMRAYYFDCLLLDGEALAERPMRERMQALDRAVPLEARIPRLVTDDADAAIGFHEAALAAGHEGVMAKSLASPYEAGSRGASWMKIKRAHTLDLVVLAAEWGNGRRAGWLSNLHLGALDPATGEYVMLGKTFKGLTDAVLAWQTAELLARETTRDASTVHVRPELVVEIAFSDLQASPRYQGGLALRLARVKRYREDKSAAEADTMDSVRRIHAAQG
ncbi:MAG TPA: ATP-dependent DNA ligase [Steroidobacteraceae bacterium]|nr:ATP-dependent DNA ligase [Steroidobacteraceae bacterium]